MPLPPLLFLADQEEYRAYFEKHYVNGPPVITFDGIRVAFYPETFDHAFFRDTTPTAGDKACFDLFRAQRMNWIRAILGDPGMEIYRRVMPNRKVRRIALEPSTPYAVVMEIRRHNGIFITAYKVDSGPLQKMRGNPRW